MIRDQALRNDLSLSSWEALLSNGMTGAGETFFPAFSLALGGSAAASGLIAALPTMIGSTLQLATPFLLPHFRSYKRWMVWLGGLQAICFLPLIAMSIHEILSSTFLVYFILTVYAVCSIGALPAWNAWMGSLLPRSLRHGFLARRSHLSQLGLMTGIALGGVILEVGRRFEHELFAFAVIFALALLFRLTSLVCLSQQNECKNQFSEQKHLSLASAARRFFYRKGTATKGEARFFFFLMFYSVAVYFAAPFFNAYLLSGLQLGYLSYMISVAIGMLAKLLAFSYLSRIVRHWDPYHLMRLGLIGTALSPLGWLFSSHFVYILVLQILGGVVWAIYELGLTLVLFGLIRERERASVLSVYNFASAFMILIGTALGGLILTQEGASIRIYLVIFGLSTAFRFVGLGLFDHAVRFLKTEPAGASATT